MTIIILLNFPVNSNQLLIFINLQYTVHSYPSNAANLSTYTWDTAPSDDNTMNYITTFQIGGIQSLDSMHTQHKTLHAQNIVWTNSPWKRIFVVYWWLYFCSWQHADHNVSTSNRPGVANIVLINSTRIITKHILLFY